MWPPMAHSPRLSGWNNDIKNQIYDQTILFTTRYLTDTRDGRAKPGDIIQEKLDSTKYKNPVFEPILADPTVVKADDGWFYAYGTMDDWGDGKGSRLIPVVRSKDLVHWTYVKDAFLKTCLEGKGRHLGAGSGESEWQIPYVLRLFDLGRPNPGVGLAIADSPAGPFVPIMESFF
jgi:hypothetical protein